MLRWSNNDDDKKMDGVCDIGGYIRHVIRYTWLQYLTRMYLYTILSLITLFVMECLQRSVLILGPGGEHRLLSFVALVTIDIDIDDKARWSLFDFWDLTSCQPILILFYQCCQFFARPSAEQWLLFWLQWWYESIQLDKSFRLVVNLYLLMILTSALEILAADPNLAGLVSF